jgi:hypothetical protein
MRRSLLALLTVLCACGDDGSDMRPAARPPDDRPDAATGASVIDQDGDGLCDTTELDFGTDPEQRDSDADGVPDLIELGNGFDATDATQPSAEQIAYLGARAGATLDFPVRVTIEGTGESVAGRFTDMGSFYSDESSAQDYFGGSVAVAADPVDAVRRVDAEGASFRSVLGRTRLEFNVRFVYSAGDALSCARAYPFGYNLESDSGEILSDELFLLVVTPDEERGGSGTDYCLPAECQ